MTSRGEEASWQGNSALIFPKCLCYEEMLWLRPWGAKIHLWDIGKHMSHMCLLLLALCPQRYLDALIDFLHNVRSIVTSHLPHLVETLHITGNTTRHSQLTNWQLITLLTTYFTWFWRDLESRTFSLFWMIM